jgi:hypothetical protein
MLPLLGFLVGALPLPLLVMINPLLPLFGQYSKNAIGSVAPGADMVEEFVLYRLAHRS